MADGIESTDEEIGYLQTEFDLQLANFVLADDETRQDIAVADYEGRARRPGVGPHIRLRRARRRFVHELQALRDGDDVTPAVERFIPAVLPVLKLGLKVIGRKRVVEAIGKLVANLLRPFVGPKMSRPLANAIVGRSRTRSGGSRSSPPKCWRMRSFSKLRSKKHSTRR
jgi:hypothetical protein